MFIEEPLLPENNEALKEIARYTSCQSQLVRECECIFVGALKSCWNRASLRSYNLIYPMQVASCFSNASTCFMMSEAGLEIQRG